MEAYAFACGGAVEAYASACGGAVEAYAHAYAYAYACGGAAAAAGMNWTRDWTGLDGLRNASASHRMHCSAQVVPLAQLPTAPYAIRVLSLVVGACGM